MEAMLHLNPDPEVSSLLSSQHPQVQGGRWVHASNSPCWDHLPDPHSHDLAEPASVSVGPWTVGFQLAETDRGSPCPMRRSCLTPGFCLGPWQWQK